MGKGSLARPWQPVEEEASAIRNAAVSIPEAGRLREEASGIVEGADFDVGREEERVAQPSSDDARARPVAAIAKQ